MSDLPSFRVPPSHCPYCDYLLDAVTAVSGNGRPKAGDWTVCLQCAQLLCFDSQCIVRKPYPGEIELMDWTLYQRLTTVARAVRSLDRRNRRARRTGT